MAIGYLTKKSQETNADGSITVVWSNGFTETYTKAADIPAETTINQVNTRASSQAPSTTTQQKTVVSDSGLEFKPPYTPGQYISSAVDIASTGRTLVDIRGEAYKDYLIPNSDSNTQENTYGGGFLVDKQTADKFVAYAKSRNVKLVYNSTYRVKGLPVSAKGGGTAISGTPHATAMAIDLETVISNDEFKGQPMPSRDLINSAIQEKNARLCAMGADVISHPEFKLKWGGTKYKNAGNVDLREIDVNGKSTQVNLGEVQHFEDEDASSVDLAQTQRMVEQHTAAVRSDRDGDTVYDCVFMNESGQIVPGRLTEDQKKILAGQPVPNPKPFNTEDLRKVRMSAGQATSDGKVGNNDFVNLIRTKPSIPRDLSGTPTNRAVNVSSEQLNNLRNVSESDYKINTITNKLIKNAFNNRLPFGTQNKHNGPAAAIKLVLDKLFANKLTPAATEAWKKIKESGIDYIDNFLIERMTKVDEERYNIAQSVSDEYKIYFAGRRPTVMSVSGKLYNTYNQQWWYDFDYFYENFLRGSRAVENRIRAFLTIADAVYEIIILKFAVNGDSNFDNLLTFNLDYILLQTLHTGEYKDPVTRGAGDLSAAMAPLSLAQTEFVPEMAKYIDNYTNAIMPAATGMPMLPDVFAADNNANEKAVSREDLKNSDYAKLEKQILLNKSNINNIDEFKLKQAASGKSIFASPGHFGEDTDNIRQGSKFDDQDSANNLKYSAAPRINDDPSISPTQYINTQSNLIKAPKSPETYNNKPPSDYAPSLPDNLRKIAWARESANANKNTQADLGATYPNLNQSFSAQDRARARALESDAKAIGKEISAAYNSGSNTGQKIDYTLQALSNPRLMAKTVGIVTEAEQMINNKLNVYKPELKKLESQLKSIGKSYAEAWRNRKR